jgi:two-component system CheB/CheR fusion protein
MALHHQQNIKSYYEFLQKNDKQVEDLYKDFLINVTRFFRDQDFFDELKEKVIPRIFADLKETETCRIWVAACSTGEEAYSIGILIMEYLQENKLDHDFKIFASDVNKKCITFATKGIYNASTLADVPNHLVSKYFKHKGEYFQTVNDLRDRIIFAIHDAIADPPFINMNLISCRNFLIYLKPETQSKILKTFYFSIKENQFLALGPSESIGELNGVFKQYDSSHNLFVKEIQEYNKVRQAFKPSPRIWSKRIDSYSDIYFTPAKEKNRFVEEVTDPFSIYLLRRFVPQTMFLNEGMDVLHINGNLEAILSLPKAVAKMNLKKMLPKTNVLFFQEAIRMVIDSKESRVFKNISFEKGGAITHTDVQFEKVQLVGIEEPVILVQFDYLAAEDVPPKTIIESTYSEDSIDQERVISLQNQIAGQKRKMQSMLQQLEAANEELNSSNYELLQSNQELQSTNEELQSLNEELHTVNSELQLKNKELVTANNDISNLLKTTNIGTIFLDNKLRIRKFTKAITHQFELIQGDIGRPITSFNNKLKGVNLGVLCKEILKNGHPVEREVLDKNEQQYILRLFPYFSKSITDIEGIVITLVDINNVVKAKSE